LRQSWTMFRDALQKLREIVAGGGRILFVGRKVQVSEFVRDTAKSCGQYYVDHRWMGGTLTNWNTVSQAIKRLKDLKKQVDSGVFQSYTKKEQSRILRTIEALEKSLGGVQDMGGMPAALFVLSIKDEPVALAEARTLKIPVFGIADSNANPWDKRRYVNYPIPGNDDAQRAIKFYLDKASAAIQCGLMDEAKRLGLDFKAKKTQTEASEGPNFQLSFADVVPSQ